MLGAVPDPCVGALRATSWAYPIGWVSMGMRRSRHDWCRKLVTFPFSVGGVGFERGPGTCSPFEGGRPWVLNEIRNGTCVAPIHEGFG